MKNKIHPRLIRISVASSFPLFATMSHAVTTFVSTGKYSVTEGVAFTLGNNGASDFLFNWTDPSGAPPLSSSNISDPTLILTLGQTYTFQRITTAHPFVIMNNTAAVFMSGTDGAYSRTTIESTAINDVILTPTANFTANPAPLGGSGNTISWTPSQVGDFWYTCSVTNHDGMAGKFTVIPEPATLGLIAGGFAFAALRRRRK